MNQLILGDSLMYSLQQVEISKITIGKRFRKDLGNIKELAQSIDLVGLLQPIGITKQYKLEFGQRRLEAVKSLGLTTISALIWEDKN